MPAPVIVSGLVVLLALGPSAFAAGDGALPGSVLQEQQFSGSPEEDDACEAIIEAQDWEGVLRLCAPLLDIHDEGHRLFEFIRDNVEYARTTLAYEHQTSCLESAQSGDWDTTLASCPLMLEFFPDFIAGHLFIGLGHQAKGAPAEATAAFEQFLTAAEASPETAAQMAQQITLAQKTAGLNHLGLGDADRAIVLLRSAGEASPDDAEVHFRLGDALLETEDVAGAEAAFLTVADMDADIPQLADRLFRLGALAWNNEDREKAAELLTRYVESAPEGEHVAEAHWLLGSAAVQADNQADIITHFRAFLGAAADDPRAIEANYALGNIYFNRNQCDTALRYYQRFLRMAPRDSRAGDVNESVLDIEDGLCEPDLR